jgi:hypothetical protein
MLTQSEVDKDKEFLAKFKWVKSERVVDAFHRLKVTSNVLQQFMEQALAKVENGSVFYLREHVNSTIKQWKAQTAKDFDISQPWYLEKCYQDMLKNVIKIRAKNPHKRIELLTTNPAFLTYMMKRHEKIAKVIGDKNFIIAMSKGYTAA